MTDDRVLWAVPCIYVAPEADRAAVARALIDRAVESARAHGATALEGPPPGWLPGGADAVAAATEIFLQNGFSRVGPGARMPEMRRILA